LFKTILLSCTILDSSNSSVQVKFVCEFPHIVLESLILDIEVKLLLFFSFLICQHQLSVRIHNIHIAFYNAVWFPQVIFDNILNRNIPWPHIPEDMSPEAQDLIDKYVFSALVSFAILLQLVSRVFFFVHWIVNDNMTWKYLDKMKGNILISMVILCRLLTEDPNERLGAKGATEVGNLRPSDISSHCNSCSRV